MATTLSASNSPFTELAGFLANRYQLPKEEINPPLLELVIDSSVTLELQESGSQVYLIGVVVEPLLVHEEYETLHLLKVASSRLGLTEGTLSWDEEQKRIIFWLEVTSYTRETEFNSHLDLFLNHLDTWIRLVPPAPAT
jgi:hypothetical protein